MQQALLRARLPFGAKKAAPMELGAYAFKHDKRDYNVYWDVRKGLIPIVGAAREAGARAAIPACMHSMPGVARSAFPVAGGQVCVCAWRLGVCVPGG